MSHQREVLLFLFPESWGIFLIVASDASRPPGLLYRDVSVLVKGMSGSPAVAGFAADIRQGAEGVDHVKSRRFPVAHNVASDASRDVIAMLRLERDEGVGVSCGLPVRVDHPVTLSAGF
jgi:hypothetical protein